MLLAALAIGCAAPHVPPAGATADASAGGEADGALFLQGFAVRWEARPHRLRELGFAAQGTSVRGEELTGTLRASARGGSWSDGRLASDQPRMALRYGAVRSDDLVIRSGTAHLLVVGSRQEPARGSVTAHVPLPDGVPAIAWITSFALDTAPSHEDGFTPRRLEVDVGAPVATGDGVDLQITGELDAAPVPDRRQHLGAWGATVDVGWVVVGAPGAIAQRIDVRREIDESVDPNEPTRNREPIRVPVNVDTHEGFGSPIAGLSSFSVGLEEHGPVAGRYLRALAVGVEDEREDPARHTFDAAVALQFSNGGTIPRKVKVDARATVSVLEPARPIELRRGRWAPEGDGFDRVVRYPSLEPLPAP